jgi:hypothetical protein
MPFTVSLGASSAFTVAFDRLPNWRGWPRCSSTKTPSMHRRSLHWGNGLAGADIADMQPRGGQTPAPSTLAESRQIIYTNRTKYPLTKAKTYSEPIMRGAFVVQLKKASQGVQIEGSVEEVDTGKQFRFHSQEELIAFFLERFAETCRGVPDSEGAK